MICSWYITILVFNERRFDVLTTIDINPFPCTMSTIIASKILGQADEVLALGYSEEWSLVTYYRVDTIASDTSSAESAYGRLIAL